MIVFTVTIQDHPQARKFAEELHCELDHLIDSTDIEGVVVLIKAVNEIPLWPSP